MRRFYKIAEGVDVVPILAALARNDELWNQNPIRSTYPGSPHAAVDDILVFFNDLEASPEAIKDDKNVEPLPAWRLLPQLRPIVFGLMARVDGVRLGRVIITRLAPGESISPHPDMGAPAEYYTRYQVALQSGPGCLFHCGDETVQFRPGEIWQFDNQQTHSVINNSDDDRIVIIIDIRSA